MKLSQQLFKIAAQIRNAAKHIAYLVCHEQVEEVKKFLGQFFKEEISKYSHKNWITFIIPPILNLIL